MERRKKGERGKEGRGRRRRKERKKEGRGRKVTSIFKPLLQLALIMNSDIHRNEKRRGILFERDYRSLTKERRCEMECFSRGMAKPLLGWPMKLYFIIMPAPNKKKEPYSEYGF
jgi:hypothetical protein